MKLEVAASESSVMQKDDDSYPTDSIVEKAENQHALLKNPKSMDKNENVSEDASEEVCVLPETLAETIKPCLPEAGIKLAAPSISSVDEAQHTHDDIRHEIHSAEKGDMESTLPKEQDTEIMQTSSQECSSINMGDNIANDSKVVEVEHEYNEVNSEVSQMSSMLLKPDIEKTAEYVSDEMDEEKFSEKILPPIKEKSVEQPFYKESRGAGDISAQLKAEDDSSMKTTEIQVENKHIPLTAESKSPQDLNYEKERDNEGMSTEDAQQISEHIIESSNISSAHEEAEPTSEPQQSYEEILEPSQIICEGANDLKENANDSSTEREVTTSTEAMLVDSSSNIKECSKQIESEIYESKTIRSEDGAYVDQLDEQATIEATEKSSQVGLAAVTGPANIQQNDEHQTCQTEVEENETISEMIKQNRSFPESDLQEENVISTESISYDNANIPNAALEGDDDERVELTAEETGYSLEEQNVETTIHEPCSSDQIASTDEISVPFSEKGDSAISTDSDKISSLNDNGNMESIDTEAKLDMTQEVENKREIVVETASDDITEEIDEESYMVLENQVDNLTNKATDEPALVLDSTQNISFPAEDQINKLTDVSEEAYESVGENNVIDEEYDSTRSPDKDPEKDFESNNEETRNDSKLGQSCRNEADIVKHLEIVNPEIEETKLDQGEQNQENSIHNDAIGPDGDAQSTFTNIEPTSPENHEVKIDEIMEETVSEIEQKNIENVELRSIRDVTSAEENLVDNVTSEASINKGDDQNDIQSLSVICVEAGTEAEDTINKTDGSEKEVDLQYTEETQSTRDDKVESYQRAITDEIEVHKNLENTNADPSQQHDETNNENSNYNEESNEYKGQEHNESNEFHLEDESNTEEAKNQVYGDGSSSNKEGIRTVDVPHSQDEDSIHVIEVEETTDKHEEQEDRNPYGEHDGVLADQLPQEKHAVECEDDKHGENIQVSESENQGLLTKEVDNVTEANKDHSFDQLPKDLEHSNDAQTFENEGAQKDGKQVLLEAGSDVEEFQEMNVNPMELRENPGTASDNTEVQDDGQDDEEGVPDDIAKTVLVTDPKIEGEISTGIPSQSGKLDQEINADNPVTSRDKDTEETSEAMQVVDIHEEVSADCLVSPQEVIPMEAGTDIQQENESSTASLDCKQDQEDQRGHEFFKNSKMDESHPEKDTELINQGFEQDSISSETACQKTSTAIEALRQDIGMTMDDHTLNEPSEIANDKAHIVEASNKADFETEQHNQTNEEPEHENEISAEESMDVENREFIPESAELREENITENEPINTRAADLGSNTVEDLSGNENTNLEISEKVINLDEDPKVNTEVMPQDKSVENCELIPESAELAEDNNTKNEAISSRAMDLGSNTVEDLSGNENTEISQKVTSLDEDPRVNTEDVPQDTTDENCELVPESAELAEENNTENEAINRRAEDLGSNTVEDGGSDNTNLEISQKEINTEVVRQDMDVENHELIPESTKQREENKAENEAINSRAADLSSNTVEDLSGNENTHSEISNNVAKLDEDPRVNTEVMPQDVSVENLELIPESVELTEENNTKNEAVNSTAEDQGPNTVEDRGNENTNLEISQTEMEISLNKNPVVNREVVLQELREENNTENEAIKSRGEDLGSNTIEDLTGYENTNLEIPQQEINSNEDPTVNTEIVPQDIEVENHKLIPESTELREDNNTDNEAINVRAENDLSGYENTNSEMSPKVTNLKEDPRHSTEVMPQDMSVENQGFISESAELREENNTENEAVNSIAKGLGSNTVEDLSGNKNTNSEISQKEINLDEDPIVDTDVVLQDMSVEDRALVPESAELTKENNIENEAINNRAKDLGSNTVEDSGNENTNFGISQKEISLNENPIVNTDVVLQDMDVESHKLIPQLREENSTDNEAIKCREVGLGSNIVEDHSGIENTNSEISQKLTNLEEKNTEIMPQVMGVENLESIPESIDIRKENNAEKEAINGSGEDLGSNTIENHTGNGNSDFEVSQREINSEEEPTVIEEIVPQDMDVENQELIPESTELREETNTENEAINSEAADLGSNTVEDLSGKENTNSEMSQKVTNLAEDPRVDTEVVPQDVDVGDHEIIPESTELSEENTTENEAINSKADDLGSNTIEDFTGNENTTLEISQKEISLNEDPVVETEGVLQDMDVENHKFIPESTELIEVNNTENEAIDSKEDESCPNTAGDLGGNENTNSEISQKEINLDENPIVKTMENIQDDEEPENTERESTQEGSQHTLAEERTIDQEKPIDTADAPQLENEEKTCMFNEMNESVSFKDEEIESQGLEDDSTNKRILNEHTPMHSEAPGQDVGAEMPNQDNEECRIDASEVNNTEEVPEHDEHRNEVLVDKINEHEVISTNASSSGNEMDTTSSEVKNDETLFLADQTTESLPGISQTNNADQGPELGVHEQSMEGNEEDDGLDYSKPMINVEMVVNSIEESEHKDDREGIPSEQEDPNHLVSQDNEINGQPTQTLSGNGILTTIEPSQYIEEWESNDAKQEENVSNMIKSYIDGHDIEEMTPDETVQTQGEQLVEPEENFLEPSSPSDATSTTPDIKDSSVTSKDLNKEKEEDPTPEKATQKELQVSSGFELCGDLPYIPAVEEVSKTEEFLMPETQGANDPQDGEKMEHQSYTNSYSHDTASEADQVQPKSQQTIGASLTNDSSIGPISEKYGHMSEGVTENLEETKCPDQLMESNNEEQTVEDIIDKRGHQAVKSEMTVKESTVEENYKSQGTPEYSTAEEKTEISIETKPPEEVDNMGEDTQSSRVEELKDENADETRGCEDDTVTNEETVFHGRGMRNLSHGNQGIDTNVEAENSGPIKDDYSRTSADEVMVAKDEHYGNIQSERTSKTIDAGNSEEKQVPAGSVEIVERSSEPVSFKENKRDDEDEIMEEKKETNADAESHEPKFYKTDNDADRDETLSNTECNTESDECSIAISKDSKEISEEPNILVKSTSLEGEAVGKIFQQNSSGERTENEVRPMELKMDTSELLHQTNVPKPDNMDVEKEKQQELAKGLECCTTLEPQQGNDRICFTEMEVPEDVDSREIDSGHSEAKLKVEEIQSEGNFSNANDLHMDCHEAEKISAADIIASHICQEIETEDKLKQPSSEHQKQGPEISTLVADANDTIFDEEVLHEGSTENTFRSFDNPTEIVCAPEEREIEHTGLEAEPSGDLEQKQDLKENHRTMDTSVRTDLDELSSELQGDESSAEVESDIEDSTLERLNVKEDSQLNEKRETDESSQLNFESQSISGENLVNSCGTSTINQAKTEIFEPVIELQSEKLAISEETVNDTHLQTVKNELMGESSPSNFEVYKAVATDTAGEEEVRVNTTVACEDRALVQPPLPTTKSCDETKKPLIADEHSANTTFSVSQVPGVNNTPPTETNATEDKVSEQPPMKKVSNQDSNVTQTMQIDKEEQVQGNYEDLHQPSQLQELCGKDSVNTMIEDPVDTVDVIYNGMNVEDFSKEGSESTTNEVPSLEPMQSVTASKEEITADKHIEMEEKPMLSSIIGEKKGGEDFAVKHNLQDDEKNTAEEPKTEKEKEDTENDHGEEDSELIPMISEASRDIELKTQNKKSLHILSGMGSKMKNSISKVKKAMACASPQFSPDDVIIKLNKSKKS